MTAAGDREAALGWVTAINSRADRPDLVLLLEVSAEEAARRRQGRGGAEEMYEDLESKQTYLNGLRSNGIRVIEISVGERGDRLVSTLRRMSQ